MPWLQSAEEPAAKGGKKKAAAAAPKPDPRKKKAAAEANAADALAGLKLASAPKGAAAKKVGRRARRDLWAPHTRDGRRTERNPSPARVLAGQGPAERQEGGRPHPPRDQAL